MQKFRDPIVETELAQTEKSVIIKVAINKVLKQVKVRFQKEFLNEKQTYEHIQAASPKPGCGILKCLAVSDQSLRFLFEFIPCNLAEYCFFSDKNVLKIAWDIAREMKWLHARQIIHGDLTASNILVFPETRKIRISDFGMSSIGEKQLLPISPPEKSPSQLFTFQGTPGSQSPELLEHGLLTSKADTFSFGIVLLQLLQHGDPYESLSNEMLNREISDLVRNRWGTPHTRADFISFAILSGWRPLPPLLFQNQPLIHLIRQCLAQNALERPSFVQIERTLRALCRPSASFFRVDENGSENDSENDSKGASRPVHFVKVGNEQEGFRVGKRSRSRKSPFRSTRRGGKVGGTTTRGLAVSIDNNKHAKERVKSNRFR